MEVYSDDGAEQSENIGEHHYHHQHHRHHHHRHQQQHQQHQQFSHQPHDQQQQHQHHQSEWLGASALDCATKDEEEEVIEPGAQAPQQPESSNAKERSKVPRAKLCFYTILIFFSYTIYGVSYNLWGPTWMDLIALLQSSQDQMAYGNSLMAIGYILGSFTSPFLFEHFGRQLFIALYIVLIAAAILVTPLLGNYYVFLGASVAFGVGEGGFDTGINAWMFEMYLDENGPLVQAMYFFYGLGTLFSPLICLNFLSDNNFVDENYQLVSLLTRDNGSNSSASQLGPIESSLHVSVIQMGQHVPHHSGYFFPWLKRQFVVGDFVQSQIEVPFIIVSSLLFSTAAIHLLCHLFLRYEADEEATILRLKNPLPSSQAEVEADEKVKCLPPEIAHCCGGSSSGHSNYGTAETAKVSQLDQNKQSEQTLLDRKSKMKIALLVFIGGAMACFYDGMENISFEYMTSFLVNTALSISESEAAQMVSALSAAYTIARGVGILLILRVPPRFLLLVDTALIFAGLSLLYFNMNSSRAGLYGGLVVLGVGTATFMPTMFSYFEEHIRLTDKVCALLTLSCALVSTVDPIIVGRLISSLPAVVLYINYASIVVVAIAFTLFDLVLLWR